VIPEKADRKKWNVNQIIDITGINAQVTDQLQVNRIIQGLVTKNFKGALNEIFILPDGKNPCSYF
jgi:hypothetical protein